MATTAVVTTTTWAPRYNDGIGTHGDSTFMVTSPLLSDVDHKWTSSPPAREDVRTSTMIFESLCYRAVCHHESELADREKLVSLVLETSSGGGG